MRSSTPSDAPLLRLATRGSALALAQAHHVSSLLGAAEIVEVVTTGDRRRDLPDKQKWVSKLEESLAGDAADLAVHSAKDVPANLPDGFLLAGVPGRETPWDALCGADSLDALPEGARVGTSSVRRAAGLHAIRPDLAIVELRGNVDTRLRKLADGACDAIVLALAGLARLGREGEAGCVLHELVPAPGQGSLLLEARAEDEQSAAAAERITDPDALRCLLAERALVRALQADCETPVGAHATVQGSGGALHLRAFVGRVDGSHWLRDELEGDDADALGREVANRLLAAGAQDLLR
jgi:hydroxymethylbilane synthase